MSIAVACNRTRTGVTSVCGVLCRSYSLPRGFRIVDRLPVIAGPSTVPDDRKLNLEAKAEHPDREAHCDPEQWERRAVGSRSVSRYDEGRARQGRHGVEIVPQYRGDLPQEDVTQHAAADAGQRSQDDGLCGSEMELDRLVRPG